MPRRCAPAGLPTPNSTRCTSSTAGGLGGGVFGAPSFVLPSGEIFWGQDRLELLERALKMLRQPQPA